MHFNTLYQHARQPSTVFKILGTTQSQFNFTLISSKSIRNLFINVKRYSINCLGLEIDALSRLKHRKLRSCSLPGDNFSAETESRRTIYSIASLTGKTVDPLLILHRYWIFSAEKMEETGRTSDPSDFLVPSNENHAHESRIYTDDLFMLGEFGL